MKIEKDVWVVISGGSDFEYSLICFRNEEEFYWGQSNSRCIMLDHYSIVEVLGKFPSKEWDKLEINYIKKYYPLKSNKPTYSAGWISPKGKFYPCAYGHHRGLSKKISANIYDTIEDTERVLEKNGWIKIYKNGVIGWDDLEKDLIDVLTDKQKEVLFDLSMIEGDKEWSDRLKRLCSKFN